MPPVFILLTRGERTAFGDGFLRADDVVHALATVRAPRGAQLPDLPEHGAIGAAYDNASYAGAVTHTHPDHRAVLEVAADGRWEAGETDAAALMSRVQTFWQRF